MGLFDRVIRGITTGGLSEWTRGGSGRSRSRPGRVQSEWDRISGYPGQFDSSGGPPGNLADSGIYDEFGFTRGLPGSHIAPDVQYGAEQVVTRRNDALMARGGQQAQAALSSGVENLQAYRPGAAAALLSPYYQSAAQAYLTTAAARRTDAPNLMFRYDEKVRKSAEESARNAGYVSGLAGLAGTVLGALTGGGFSPSLAINQAPSGDANAGMVAQNATGYGAPIGPPQAGSQQLQGGGGPPQSQGMIGPPQAGAGGLSAPGGGRKQLGGGFGGSPAGGGGGGGQPGAGPQTGPGTAPGRGGGGGGGGGGAGAAGMAGGGGMTRYPADGPATDFLAQSYGADPGLLSAVLSQLDDPQPDFARAMHSRLNLIMARDASFLVTA